MPGKYQTARAMAHLCMAVGWIIFLVSLIFLLASLGQLLQSHPNITWLGLSGMFILNVGLFGLGILMAAVGTAIKVAISIAEGMDEAVGTSAHRQST